MNDATSADVTLTPEQVLITVAGASLVAIGAALLLQVPQVRDLGARVADNPVVQKVGGEIVGMISRSIASALGANITP